MLFGRNNIFKVCQHGSEKDLIHLIKQGVDLNQQDSKGKTPLHVAGSFGHIELVRILLSKGASKAAKDDHGKTPLEYAREAFKILRAGIEEAYNLEDEATSVRSLMKSLTHLLRMRNNHPTIQDETSQLPFEKYVDASEERIKREFFYAKDFMHGIKGYGNTSEKIILMMGSVGPRQVAYRLLLLDTQRLMRELSDALS